MGEVFQGECCGLVTKKAFGLKQLSEWRSEPTLPEHLVRKVKTNEGAS